MSFPATMQASPDAALLTLFAGILLIYFECNRPGSILPGCLGALLTLLSIDAFTRMPLQPSFLALVAAGIVLVLCEVFLPARNLLAVFGAALLTLGLRNLLQPFAPARVHTPTAVITGVGLDAATLWLARIALRARRNKRSLLTPVVPAVTRRIQAPHRVD